MWWHLKKKSLQETSKINLKYKWQSKRHLQFVSKKNVLKFFLNEQKIWIAISQEKISKQPLNIWTMQCFTHNKRDANENDIVMSFLDYGSGKNINDWQLTMLARQSHLIGWREIWQNSINDICIWTLNPISRMFLGIYPEDIYTS